VSELQAVRDTDSVLTADVLTHLDAQLSSVRGLLQVVLEQGTAIRERNVQAVVKLTTILQGELQRRSTIEEERSRLLERAGSRLGVSGTAVTLELLTELMAPQAAALAQTKSAELRGLLEVVQREHHVNRALMTQELAFLDHLMRLAGAGDTSYDSAGDRSTVRHQAPGARHRVLDLEV
jgi:6,7-dimethyl-8-ribityllumazine synthase